MNITRRQFGGLALPALAAPRILAKPNSNFGGVMVGAITYSFRSLPVENTLKYCVDSGVSGIELMSNVAESYAGAPLPVMRPMGPPAGGAGARPQGGPGGPPAGGPPAGGPGGPGGRFQATPEQIAARKKAAAELSAWRTSAPMSKYKEFRKMYEDAGVKIYCFKLPPTLEMPDAEYDYIWNVAETLGADHITMELPTNDELLARVAAYAAKRKLAIAFHTHGQGGASGFDKVLSASKYTALNFDVGHYFGVNGESPLPLVEKYASRIASLHLKDRKAPTPNPSGGAPIGGATVAWGEGGTPIKEILQLMKRNKYRFPASIELEYPVPAGSDAVAEVRKCVEYCKAALA